jgi:molybdate transport system regulatory protein
VLKRYSWSPVLLSKHIKIRIPYKDEIALGPGKVDLLEAIIEAGSISAAAKTMKMSYKRAWDLVDTMNRSFKQPVVHTATGGSHGGGAEVTEFGRELISAYRAMQQKAEQAISDDIESFFTKLNP